MCIIVRLSWMEISNKNKITKGINFRKIVLNASAINHFRFYLWWCSTKCRKIKFFIILFHSRPRLAIQEEIDGKMVLGAINKTHHVTKQLIFNLSSSSTNYLVGLTGGSDTPDLNGSLAGQSTMEMPGI